MKISTYENRILVTFNILGVGNELSHKYNNVCEISSKYDAQQMLFQNVSNWKRDKNGEIIQSQMGNIGGTVTFHSHSCDINTASNELIQYLKSIGLSPSYYEEVVKHFRKDGTKYKRPQHFLEIVQ
jgi:hypothetical protein